MIGCFISTGQSLKNFNLNYGMKPNTPIVRNLLRTGVQLEASLCRAVIGMRYADMKPVMEGSWGLGP
ncbi:hypothetical protein RYX36_007573 [Vicia faba]